MTPAPGVAAGPVGVAGLSLRAVRASYGATGGRTTILDGVDLDVAPGEVVAVAGRSGSGKTTLLTVVAGWAPPDDGLVRLDGAPVDPHLDWAQLTLVPQSLGLLEELTVAENVELAVRLRAHRVGASAGPEGDATATLAALGLDHLVDRRPDELSLGEQQRVALARAVMARPRLLVADEPVSHQNRAWAEASLAIVVALARLGTAVLVASHDDVVLDAADRVLDLVDGRLHPRTG